MPDPLTARSERVKQARKLSRRSVRSERRLFLADGPKAVEAALAADPPLATEVFATAAARDRFAGLLDDAEVTLVDDSAIAALSDSVTPAGVVAVCRPLDVAWQQVPASAVDSPLWVICADVRDPGNAGTVIRTADAAGAGLVVLAGDSVDLHNPKTIRASVGSAFHVPIVVERDVRVALERARAAGHAVLAADGAGEADLDDLADSGALAAPTAWLFGNEAWGLPEHTAALADRRVAIPIHGRAESLNLSTAAAVCLYASARAQRHR